MKKKKDILFLCQFFYPEYISSATLPYDTALALVKAGHSVNVLCGVPKEYNNKEHIKSRETHQGIQIQRVKYLQMIRKNMIGRLLNYFSFTMSILFRLFHLRNYKVILVYSNPPILPLVATLSKKLFGTKVVFVCFDVYPEIAVRTNILTQTGMITRFMKGINRFLFRNVDAVVALSEDMKKFLRANRNLSKDGKLVVIPNWYEDQGGSKSINRVNPIFEKLDTEHRTVVSYFGNLGIAQDIDTIIDAMLALRKEKDIVFLFAGHGKKLPYLKERIKEEGLEQTYVYDFLHGQDFQDALNLSDIFLVSLEKSLTGLAVPSKTYSYLMAGKPVISIMESHADIAIDLMENEAGCNVCGGHSEDLVKAVIDLHNDSDKRIKMGENARRLFLKKYTTEICTQKYVDLINQLR